MTGIIIILVLLISLTVTELVTCLIAGIVDKHRGKVDSIFKYIKEEW